MTYPFILETRIVSCIWCIHTQRFPQPCTANMSCLQHMVGGVACGHIQDFGLLSFPCQRKKKKNLSFVPGRHRNQHHPLTPCNSIDPTRLDPQEIERVRQAGTAKTVDPNALAKSLSKIRVQENGQTAKESVDDARMRNIEERLKSQRFDVFLSFAEEDQDFAEEVRHRIVSKLKLRVFVPSEGDYILSHVLSTTFYLPSYPSILLCYDVYISLSLTHKAPPISTCP